ncbi:MAG: hypothetical protein ACRDL8_06540, partial [Solirubrobacteraceae bacterium]
TWTLPKLRDELASGAERLTLEIEGDDKHIELTHDLSESERAILLDGGLLNHLRQGDGSGWDAEHADEDHDHAHVLRGEQGYGGHHG